MSEREIRLRGSYTPLAMECPGAVHDSGTRVDPVHAAPVMGQCAHAVMQEVVANGGLSTLPDDFEQTCALYGVDPEVLRPLIFVCLRAWGELKGSFPSPTVERRLACRIGGDGPGLVLTGSPDLYSYVSGKTTDTIRVLDWKTGYVDADCRNQIFAYFALLWAQAPDEGREINFEAAVVRPRLGVVDWIYASRKTLETWQATLINTVRHWDGTYRPGPHCHHCPLAMTCEARTNMMSSLVADITDTRDNGAMQLALARLASDDPAMRQDAGVQIHSWLAAGRVITDRLKVFRAVIRQYVQEDGALPISDKQEYRIVSQQRSSVKMADLPDEIERHLRGNTWVSQTRVKAAAQQVGANAAHVLESLDQAGALRESHVDQMKACNKPTSKPKQGAMPPRTTSNAE